MDRGMEVRRDMIPGRGRFYSKFPKSIRELSPDDEKRERRITIFAWVAIGGITAIGAWLLLR